jgi:hypothetical protein
MTKDDIIRIARQAGWGGFYSKPLFSISLLRENFLKFANLIAETAAKTAAEAEREECAKIVQRAGLSSVAAAIRARGKE